MAPKGRVTPLPRTVPFSTTALCSRAASSAVAPGGASGSGTPFTSVHTALRSCRDSAAAASASSVLRAHTAGQKHAATGAAPRRLHPPLLLVPALPGGETPQSGAQLELGRRPRPVAGLLPARARAAGALSLTTSLLDSGCAARHHRLRAHPEGRMGPR